MYNSKLASLIEDAVHDCITYGCGRASYGDRRYYIDVDAFWEENETDIEITVRENGVIRFTFTERIPEEYR